jgi:hypothetical protein
MLTLPGEKSLTMFFSGVSGGNAEFAGRTKAAKAESLVLSASSALHLWLSSGCGFGFALQFRLGSQPIVHIISIHPATLLIQKIGAAADLFFAFWCVLFGSS